MSDTEGDSSPLSDSRLVAALARVGSEETAMNFVLGISFAMLAVSGGFQVGLCEAAYVFEPTMETCVPHVGSFASETLPGTPVEYRNAWNNANLGMAVGTMGIVLGGVSLWAKGVMRSPA